jgi:hypothetical protein
MERWIVDNRVRYQRGVLVAVGETLVLLVAAARSLCHGCKDGIDQGLPAV